MDGIVLETMEKGNERVIALGLARSVEPEQLRANARGCRSRPPRGDGDEDPDLAAMNSGSDYISILFNNGDGTYSEQVTRVLGMGQHDIASANLDGDQDQDLVVAMASGDYVAVLLNNGDGTFADEVAYATNYPTYIAIGDLDGDEDLDMAVANWGADTVSVLMNNGDGTFAPQVSYAAGGGSGTPEQGTNASMHQCTFHAVNDATEIRDLILARLQRFRQTGLGDPDDEKPLVDIGSQMLAELGYRVETRTSSFEALEAFKAKSDQFDLVITDMQMPGLSGESLASKIAEIRSDIPVLICSGFSSLESTLEGAADNVSGILMKPLILKDLAIKIRKIFDATPPKGEL